MPPCDSVLESLLAVLFILQLLHVLFLTFLISFLLFIPARTLVRRTRLPYPLIIVLYCRCRGRYDFGCCSSCPASSCPSPRKKWTSRGIVTGVILAISR